MSVIITCYNQETFIGQAIDSLLNQTFQNWECWIVDDGSSDNTAAICMEFAKRDKRIRYIHQTNSGVSAARNKGYVLCSGKYIQFLDGDDFLLPEKLEVQVEFMNLNPEFSVTYTSHLHLWQSTGNYAHYKYDIVEQYPLEQLLFKYEKGLSIPIHSALLRKKIWGSGELPFPIDFNHRYEDWIFWVSLALKNERFCFIDKSLAVYRMHNQNFVGNPRAMAISSIQAAFYISSKIPVHYKERFEEERLEFILSRYTDQLIESREKNTLRNKLRFSFRVFAKKVKYKAKKFC